MPGDARQRANGQEHGRRNDADADGRQSAAAVKFEASVLWAISGKDNAAVICD